MPRVRATETKIVRHRTPDGRVTEYHYDRITGARVPPGSDIGGAGKPSTPANPAAFQRFLPGPDAPLGDVVRAWRYSTHFADLSASTQRNYTGVMRLPVMQALLDVPCNAINQRALRALRDGIAEAGRHGPRGRAVKPMANLVLGVLSACFAWGVENCDLEGNPAIGVKRLRLDGGGHLPWSDAAVAEWLARAPEWAGRVIQLGLWTALRAADLVALRWDAWDGSALHVTPHKTRRSSGVALYLPLSPEANETLAAWKRSPMVGLTILTQARGQPWGDSNYLAQQMKRTHQALGLPAGTVHGLRVTAATRLVEAGVPTRDVMALTGHTREDTFAKYVRQADQRQRVERAASAWAKIIPIGSTVRRQA